MRTLSFARDVWRIRRGATVRPRMLTYVVTFRCNARCIMCDSWRKPGDGDLEPDVIRRIFHQLPRMDAVRLTGGEPFVRADFPEIAESAARLLRPRVLHVTTNGFLTDRVVRFCESRQPRRLLHLLVSVDGVGAKHDTVRGRADAWQRVMETLEALAPRRRELGLRLAVNQTVVDAEGAEHYGRLRDRLAPLAIRNHLIVAYEESATYNLAGEIELPPDGARFGTFGAFSRAQIRDLLDEAERDLATYPWPERVAKRFYLGGVRSRLLRGTREPNPRCVALNAHLRLLPNGDVPTCQFNTKSVGNLRERPFAEVWRAATTDRQRDWVRRCRGCWAECEVLPNAVYTAAILRPARRARTIRELRSGM
jgi:MoaA/NifB/PqqE/SkfB family radical SAM enzyme